MAFSSMRTVFARLASKSARDRPSSQHLQSHLKANVSQSKRGNDRAGHRGSQGQGSGRRSQSGTPQKYAPSISSNSLSGSRGRSGQGQIYGSGRSTKLDARFSPAEQESLISKLHNISSGKSGRIVRPNFGKSGIATTLRTNLFALKYPAKLVVYEYTLTFSPEISPTEKRTLKRVYQSLESTPEFARTSSHVTHDGAQKLRSSRRLPSGLTIRIPLDLKGEKQPKEDGKGYELKFTGPIERKIADLEK